MANYFKEKLFNHGLPLTFHVVTSFKEMTLIRVKLCKHANNKKNNFLPGFQRG